MQKEVIASNGKKIKGVWNIVENEHLSKSYWVRLGSAYTNRDDSLNVYLDAYPKNGMLHIRDLQLRENRQPSMQSGSHQQLDQSQVQYNSPMSLRSEPQVQDQSGTQTMQEV